MLKKNYIFILLVFVFSKGFSQKTFTNLDSLLTKNFDAVNKRDSSLYLSLINQSAVFSGKKLKSKNDSLQILQPFTDSYNNLIESITDMATDPDATVTYDGYEFRNKPELEKVKGKLMFNVKLIVNNAFSVKIPFLAYADNGKFSIESPMMVMFLEEK